MNSNLINNDEYDGEFFDDSLQKFENYEKYLDSFITAEDEFYLEDIELARQLKEQGYRSKTEILSREEFYNKKKAIEEQRLNQNKDKTQLLTHKEVEDQESIQKNPFLRELAKREQMVLNGRLLTIIFIRYQDDKCEKSGYIDLNHRFKTEDFKQYFRGKKLLVPKSSDLSYYNWNTGKCFANDSPNFKVDASKGLQGLCFRNKRDRKVIYVDPVERKDDESQVREKIDCEEYCEFYKQVVFYDHHTRKKTTN